MALFWFVCGILLIYAIARYNESNKLFWTLLVSFIGAFTVASIVLSSDNNEKKNVTANISPTQLYVSASNTYVLLADVSHDTTNDVPKCTSVAVSQDYYVSEDILSCNGVNNLEDKPPQTKQLCYNTSILHNNISQLNNFSFNVV